MISFHDLCILAADADSATPSLREACTQPRSSADMLPLPAPDGEAPFDSSWDVLLAGTDAANPPGNDPQESPPAAATH
jgi:hypothetical protein